MTGTGKGPENEIYYIFSPSDIWMPTYFMMNSNTEGNQGTWPLGVPKHYIINKK